MGVSVQISTLLLEGDNKIGDDLAPAMLMSMSDFSVLYYKNFVYKFM